MTWAAVAGAGVSLVGGMLGRKSANKAAQRQAEYERQMAEWAGGGRRDAGLRYADQIRSSAAPWAEAYRYQPTQFTSGYATTNINPDTGEVGYELDPRWAAERDRVMGGSSDAFGFGERIFDQAGSFDPKEHAAERYAAAQALLAPGDQRSQQSLLQDLFNKGGFGLTTNVPAAGGGSVGTNPFVSTFANSLNERNARMSYDSLREGESYLDNILKRGRGMFDLAEDLRGQGMGIEDKGREALSDAMRWGDTFNTARQRQADKYFGTMNTGYGAENDAWNSYYGAFSGNPGAPSGASNAQMWQQGGDVISQMIKSGAFSGMFRPNNNALYQDAYGPYSDAN